MNKKKSIIKLAVVFIAILIGYLIFIFGLPLSNFVGYYDVDPLKDTINFGLDLTGGVNVVLEASESNGKKVSEDTLNKAKETISTRIDSMGVKEPTITTQGTNRISVSIPDIEDQEEALNTIGKTAKLQFEDENGKVLLDGGNVESAKYVMQKADSTSVEEPVVSLELDKEGTEKFAIATKDNLNKVIKIVLDGETISAPTVQTEITDGKCVINGMKDSKEATELATLISAGSLPVDLKAVEVRSVGPSLGQDAFNKALTAGLIGIALVFVFMAFAYLLPGIVADLSLAIYILIYLLLMSGLGVTLTLPGIAGVILSIGMAVDSNVIIFERIKEEIERGRSLNAAIDVGFSKALSSIIDANITTIIAGLVLFFLGSGTIKGFSLTLMLGVVVSMITAVFITKKLMLVMSSITGTKCVKWYGVKEEDIVSPGGDSDDA